MHLPERIQRLFARKFVRDTIILQIGKAGVLVISLLGSIVVPRLMLQESYGRWLLIVSLYGIWRLLDFTGLVPSAHTRLPEAVGAKNEEGLLTFMGFYLRTTLIYSAFSTGTLLAVNLFTPLGDILYESSEIMTLAVVLTLTQPLEMLFMLLVTAFSSRRYMRDVVIIQNLNQLVLTIAAVVAILISQTPTALVLSRVAYSTITLTIVMIHYERSRLRGDVVYPSLLAIGRAITRKAAPGDMNFGIANAFDKNLGMLFMLLPIQATGLLRGEAAAGQMGLAVNIVQAGNFFAASVLDNLRAVIPQAVGRKAYARLWGNFQQVMLALIGASVAFYASIAFVSPFVVPLLYGEQWIPAIPVVQVLVIFGAVATIGGVFGPLYRVFDFMRGAVVIKIFALAVGIPWGVWLISQMGAVGGAWMLTLFFGISVPLTAWMVVPELRHRANAQPQA